MLATRRVRDLEVPAASGLVAAAGVLHVVGDDDLDLWLFREDGTPIGRVPLFPGEELPADEVTRKARKPDLEALCALPPVGLFALGSGSRPNRMRGVWLPADGGPVHAVDLAPLYGRLAGEIRDLNIEGAAVAGGVLRLLQRGNGAGHENAVVDVDLAAVVAALAEDRPPPGDAVLAVRRVDLGSTGEIAWSFTDASPLPDGRLLFSAAAEDTDDPYEDGPVHGAALGILDAEARVVCMRPLDVALKVEGLHARPDGEALLVVDADVRGAPSPLFSARWAELVA